MSCKRVLTSFLLMMLMATIAVAASDIDAPATPGYGQKVIDLDDVGFETYGNLYTNDDTGNGFTFGMNTSGWSEQHAYYAFEVPTGSAVTITGDWALAVSSSSYWGEAGLWTCDDINGSNVGMVPMTTAQRDAAPYKDSGVSARAQAYVDTAAPGGAGYDYFASDTPDADQWESTYNYFANAQHLGPDGAGVDMSYNQGAPCYAKMDAWTNIGPSTLTSFLTSPWLYTNGGPDNRCMLDSEAPATGAETWKVTRGTGDNTQGVVVMKMGGSGARMTVQNLTLEIRGPGDADGLVGGTAKCDVTDLGVLATNYGQSGKTWEEGDFTGDGEVDVNDLGALATAYGTVYIAPAAAVPEPSIICLLGLGSLAMLLIRRR